MRRTILGLFCWMLYGNLKAHPLTERPPCAFSSLATYCSWTQKFHFKQWMPFLSDSLMPSHAKPNRINITSDSVVMETQEGQTQFYFQGNVHVISTDFEAKSESMIVYCLKSLISNPEKPENKIQKIEARGNVYIKQINRTALANAADIFPEEEKMILMGEAQIRDENGIYYGDRILLSKGQQKIVFEGQQKRPSINLSNLPNFKSTQQIKK